MAATIREKLCQYLSKRNSGGTSGLLCLARKENENPLPGVTY